MTTVVQLPALISGKAPHDIIKEYVAKVYSTHEFDRIFDELFQIGLHLGTAKYDEAMTIILQELDIPQEEIFAELQAHGVNINHN